MDLQVNPQGLILASSSLHCRTRQAGFNLAGRLGSKVRAYEDAGMGRLRFRVQGLGFKAQGLGFRF